MSAHLPHNKHSIFIVIVNMDRFLQPAERKIAPSTICFPSLLLSTAFLDGYIFINGAQWSFLKVEGNIHVKEGHFSHTSLSCLMLYSHVSLKILSILFLSH